VAVPVLNLNDGLQFVDVIQILISDELRDWVQVLVVDLSGFERGDEIGVNGTGSAQLPRR
jgi:hypothetical protein